MRPVTAEARITIERNGFVFPDVQVTAVAHVEGRDFYLEDVVARYGDAEVSLTEDELFYAEQLLALEALDEDYE